MCLLIRWHTGISAALQSMQEHAKICVRLCTLECCLVHPLNGCTADDPDASGKEDAQTFRNDLTGWGGLYIRDCAADFSYYMPDPKLHVLAERVFHANHVKGIFEQGCGATVVGEMNDLRAYILSKAMWDPGADPAKLHSEFRSA